MNGAATASPVMLAALVRGQGPKRAETVEELFPRFKGEWGNSSPKGR